MNFKEIKNTIKPLLKQYFGIPDDKVEGMISDTNTGFWSAEHPGCLGDNKLNVRADGALIKGLKILDKQFDLDLWFSNRNKYCALMTFGGCIDENAVKEALSGYELSAWGSMFYVSGKIKKKGDPLVLAYYFKVSIDEDFHDGLVWMFMNLQDLRFKVSLMPVLKQFESK